MTPLERPKNWRYLAAGFVLNNLSDEEVMLWKTLCAQDPDLEQEARQMQQTFNQFADIVPLHSPSQTLMDEMKLTMQNPADSLGNSPRQFGLKLERVSDRCPRWRSLSVLLGAGAIACLGVQGYLLNNQVQQLNQQVIDQQQQLQNASTQITDMQSQLEQATSQLTTLEEALAHSQHREESMRKILEELTQDPVVLSAP